MGKYIWIILFIPFLLFGTVKYSFFVDHDTTSHPIQVNASAPPFKGLILLGNKADLNPAGYHDVHGVMSYNVDLPGGIVKLKKMVRTCYNQPLNKETITEIKKRVTQYYRNHDHPVVTISILHQDISEGVLQLVITEGKLGKIYCKGNKWFKNDCLEEAIKLEPGENIASDILNQNLYRLNRNPFRHIDAIYTPGEENGTTNVELVCSDRFPLRIYAGIDNTGNDVTGNNRFFTGFDWGTVFWSAQRLSYQFTSSSDFKRYWAHTAFYEIPLPWQHMLNIYGGYSHVDADFAVPDIEGSLFHTHGFSIQGSLRYDIPLKPYKNFFHEITWGFDFKRTNNNLDLGGVPVISENNVNLTQLMLGYNISFKSTPLSISWEVEGFWSPGKCTSNQTNADYESLRPFTKNQYVYTRTALTFIWCLYKDWSIHNCFRGQLANINLLPSEEYGIGGYNTVRGYKERIVNGDTAFIWNLEFHAPPVSILNVLAGWKKFYDEIQFLVFYDYGLSGVKQTAPSQKKTTYLMSFGPGIRYNVTPYLTFRADWGFQLHNLHFGGPYQRLHLALIVGY